MENINFKVTTEEFRSWLDAMDDAILEWDRAYWDDVMLNYKMGSREIGMDEVLAYMEEKRGEE